MEKVQVDQARLKRSGKRPRYDTFTDWARDAARVFTTPIARFLGKLGFHPNTITVLGFVLILAVTIVLATGQFRLGGALLLIVAPIDALDGAVARLVGKKSRFGAFLDSTLDRFSDAALLCGLMFPFLMRGATTEVILTFATLTGSTMVSYVRARAEALDFPCKVGLMTRMERVVLLAVGLILGLPTLTLWLLAVGSIATAVHRVVYVFVQSRKEESPTTPGG